MAARTGERDLRNFAWYYLRRLCHDERLTLRGHKGAVNHAEFSRDGRTLVSCGYDGTGGSGRSLPAGRSARSSMAPRSTGLRSRPTAALWRLWVMTARSSSGTSKRTTGRATIPAHQGDAIAVCFTQDGRRLISAGRKDRMVKLWDLATKKELASAQVDDPEIESMRLAPDGATLATAGGDGYARLWNSADMNPERSIRVGVGLYGLAFSADGTRPGNGRCRWSHTFMGCARRRAQRGVRGPHPSRRCTGRGFHIRGPMLVSADGHAMVRQTDAITGKIVAVLNGHTDKIWGRLGLTGRNNLRHDEQRCRR